MAYTLASVTITAETTVGLFSTTGHSINSTNGSEIVFWPDHKGRVVLAANSGGTGATAPLQVGFQKSLRSKEEIYLTNTWPYASITITVLIIDN